MSNTHDGVSCDNCMKSNFLGKRYKCLICYDFDLCSSCYDQSQVQLGSTNASSSSSSSSIQDTSSSKRNKFTKTKTAESAAVQVKPPAAVQPITNNVQINQSSHLNSHAMQCILTRTDHELFYGNGGGGGIISDFTINGDSGSEQHSFTCPYCAKFGFSETSLCKHLSTQHTTASSTTSSTAPVGQDMSKKEVVCPICAVLPSSNGGDPNHLTDNLLQHINMEHNSTKNSNKNLDDTLNDIGINSFNGSGNTNTSLSANAAAAAAAALRFSRRLNYSQNTSRSSLASQSGITIGNSSNRASGNSINRYAFQFGQSSGGTTGSSGANNLSSFMRSTSHGLDSLTSSLSNQMDPIAELLSQLTGVRRAVSGTSSTNNQLQQLQAQLNRERESLHQQSAAAAVIAAAAIGNGQSGSQSTRHQHHLFSGGIGGNMTKSQLLNSLAASKSGNQNNQLNNNSTNQANNMTNAFSSQVLELPPNSLFMQSATPRDPRYLLSKYDFNSSENQSHSNKLNQINQSLFINDILTTLIVNQLNSPDSSLTEQQKQAYPSQKPHSNTNKSSSQDSLLQQISQMNEEDLAEEFLKTSLETTSATEMCMKTKSSLVSGQEEPAKFLEL